MKKRHLALGAFIAGGALWIRNLFSVPGFRGPESDHFDGERFHNLDESEHGALDFFRWRLTADQGEWPDWIDSVPGPAPPARVDAGIRVTWVNHATTLLQIDGVNLLTDPIWSFRCSPVDWAGPRRHRPPGIRFSDLPEIDAVLLSHNHYDHLDLRTLRNLSRYHHPLILTGLGNRRFLEESSIGGALDLDWWERHQVGDVSVTFVPARHFSSRGLSDRDRTLWGGFVISGPSGSIYFAGDTGNGRHFEMIRDRCGSPTVTLMPIGAYLPRWFMEPMHIAPDDVIDVHELLGTEVTIPIHWGTFPLGDDGADQPVELLRREVERRESSGIEILQPGEHWERSEN